MGSEFNAGIWRCFLPIFFASMGIGGIGKHEDKSQSIWASLFSTRLHIRAYNHHHQLVCTCIFSSKIALLMVLYENTMLAITEEILSPLCGCWLIILSRVPKFKDDHTNIHDATPIYEAFRREEML